MVKQGKISTEQKVSIAQEYLNGEGSFEELAKIHDCDYTAIKEWVARYNEGGTLAFVPQDHNRSYSEELKLKAVRAYLGGERSYITLHLFVAMISRAIPVLCVLICHLPIPYIPRNIPHYKRISLFKIIHACNS